jgi:ABC-type polysaccharide/polyol phosphate export permease
LSSTIPQAETRLAPRRSLPAEGVAELKRAVRYRPLVRYGVAASLRTENTGTFFGAVWWLLDPLLLMAVYVVFVDVILDRGGPDYPVFVLTGVITWKFFQAGVRNSIGFTLAKERQMRQVAFPKVVLPFSSVTAEAIHVLFGVGVLLLVAVAFGIAPSPVLALLPLVVAVQFVFTLGVAFLLSALNVFFRDVNHLTSYVFQLWFYLSPALYPVSAVPAQYRDLYELNPFATFLPAYQGLVIDHSLPDFGALGAVAAVSVAVLVFGYLVFVRLEPSFTKVM